MLVDTGRIEVRDVEQPVPRGDGDVLIRTELSCICGSDVHQIFHDWTPDQVRPAGFPCHETVGIVVESRSPRFGLGQRVLGTPDLLHAAGFAEYQVLPDRFLLPIPYEDVPTESIIFAQQLGTTIYAMKRFWQGPGAGTAVIIGAGSAGLSFTALCRIAGFEQVIVADLHQHRLNAAAALGATKIVLGAGRIVDAVSEATDGAGAELVIEASGKDSSRLQAFDCVMVEGMIGLFGMPEHAELAIPLPKIFRRKPTITMRWDAQTEEGQSSFKQAMELIASGRVDTSVFALRTFGIDEVRQALELAQDPKDGQFIKGGIVFA